MPKFKAKKHRLTFKILGVVCAVLSISLSINIVSAVDIPIESYVTGGLTLTTSGDWNSGISLNDLTYSTNAQTATWDSLTNEDYISFVDDTSTSGFHILINNTDLIYSGSSQTQTDLLATNLKILGNYNGSTTIASNIEVDNDTATASILSDSCSTAINNIQSTFTFNSELTTSTFTLNGSTSNKLLFESTSDCFVKGHLRFNRFELSIPENSKPGNYSGTINLIVIDGPY